MKTFIITLCLLTWLNQCMAAPEMMEVVHTVQEGETLSSVAQLYITNDRALPEFTEGIVENNYDLFKDRPNYEIYPGEKLMITFWK